MLCGQSFSWQNSYNVLMQVKVGNIMDKVLFCLHLLLDHPLYVHSHISIRITANLQVIHGSPGHTWIIRLRFRSWNKKAKLASNCDFTHVLLRTFIRATLYLLFTLLNFKVLIILWRDNTIQRQSLLFFSESYLLN